MIDCPQGDALCGNSGPPSVDSVDPIDVDLPVSPDSYVVPECSPYLSGGPQYGPNPEYGPGLEYGSGLEYGPLPDPALGQLQALQGDDTITGRRTLSRVADPE